jgi:large subunit ribosomal protein L24
MVKKIKNESKLKLRIGDTVIVNSGVEKGKKGKIVKVLRADNKIVAGGINVRTKHVKPRKQGEESGIIKIESPINISKVNYFCEKCDKGVRLGTIVKDGKRIRVCKKCGTEIK